MEAGKGKEVSSVARCSENSRRGIKSISDVQRFILEGKCCTYSAKWCDPLNGEIHRDWLNVGVTDPRLEFWNWSKLLLTEDV